MTAVIVLLVIAIALAIIGFAIIFLWDDEVGLLVHLGACIILTAAALTYIVNIIASWFQ